MILRRLLVVSALLFTTVSIAGGAQAVQVPARDGVQAPQEGTASISGRIIANDESAQPVKRAILLLSGGGLVIPRQSTTTDDGRFNFRTLPAGRFTLQAWRAGFVRDMYGNKRPGIGPGAAIVVGDGAQVTITMKMTRAASISGTVIGLPSAVQSLRVVPFQFQRVDGERRLVPAPVSGVSPVGGFGALVDDRGVYRLYGLPPGEYLVGTTTFTSGAPDTRIITAQEVRWAQQQFGPRPPVGGPPSEPPLTQPVAYAPAYFPGTVDPAASAAITLAAGEDRAGVDFSLPLVKVARIEGTVVDASGAPPQVVQVTLMPKAVLTTAFGFSTSARTMPDGKFIATGILPGDYVLTARGAFRLPAGTAAPTAPPGRAGGPPLGPLRWATIDLTVDGQDLSNLSLSLQPGATLSGRAVIDGTAPAQPVRFRLSLRPDQSRGFDAPPGAVTNVDGTFTFEGIAPGRYRFAPTAPLPSWSIVSAKLGDREWLDETIDIKAAEALSDLVVTISNRPMGLTGKVLDESGSPTHEFFVVAFSIDRRHWAAGTRRVAQARPDNTGGFSMTTLPAGDYYVAALEDLDPGQLGDSSFLESLIAASIRVTVNAGELKTQTLKISRRH